MTHDVDGVSNVGVGNRRCDLDRLADCHDFETITKIEYMAELLVELTA